MPRNILIAFLMIAGVIFSGPLTEGFVETSSVQKYYISFPKGCDFSRANRLLIGLHGPDSDGKEFNRIFDNIEGRDFIFATPDAPYVSEENGKTVREWSLYGNTDSKLIFTASRASSQFILYMIADIKRQYKISDVYIMGFSYGAAQAYLTGILHSDEFRGIISFGYGLKKSWFINDQLRFGNSLRVFISHGINDKSVPVSDSERTYELLRKNGYKVNLYKFEGDHEVPETMLENLIIWLKG